MDRAADRLGPNSELLPGENTTIGVVATDAKLTKEQANRVATVAHDGVARAVRPAHTTNDGDTIFCIATGTVVAPYDAVEVPVSTRNPSTSRSKPPCPGSISIVTSRSSGTTSGGAQPPCIASGVHTKAFVPAASSEPPAASNTRSIPRAEPSFLNSGALQPTRVSVAV